MANITKPVTNHIGATQYWDTAIDLNDASGAISALDVFRIENSLGRPGRTMTITAGAGAISIRINAYQVNYPQRDPQEFNNADYYTNISLGVEHIDTSQTPIVIPAAETFTWVGEVPIRTVQIVTKAANFTLVVS